MPDGPVRYVLFGNKSVYPNGFIGLIKRFKYVVTYSQCFLKEIQANIIQWVREVFNAAEKKNAGFK